MKPKKMQSRKSLKKNKKKTWRSKSKKGLNEGPKQSTSVVKN